MTILQVEAQLTTDELLRAVKQLNKNDLEKFASQVLNLRAKEQAPSLPKSEAELLQKINQGLPTDLLAQYSELAAKRQAETLTPEEHAELLKLTDQIEHQEAERAKSLAELAQLRQTSTTDLINELGIQAPSHD